MRKRNRNSPSGKVELDEGLLLCFRMGGFEGENVCHHSRRALSMEG